MTLVIATRGIDLSVGAVVAIAGAVACCDQLGSPDPATRSPCVVGDRWSRWWSRCVLGLWNGLLVAVLGIQPIVATLILMVAGRGVAQLITEGQIITFNSAAVQGDRLRLPARPAGRGRDRRRDLRGSPRC